MKRLIKHENKYSNTTINSKEFSAVDIINFLSEISHLKGLNISAEETDSGEICFTIGDDVYYMIENKNGDNSNFLM